MLILNIFFSCVICPNSNIHMLEYHSRLAHLSNVHTRIAADTRPSICSLREAASHLLRMPNTCTAPTHTHAHIPTVATNLVRTLVCFSRSISPFQFSHDQRSQRLCASAHLRRHLHAHAAATQRQQQHVKVRAAVQCCLGGHAVNMRWSMRPIPAPPTLLLLSTRRQC